MALGENGSFWYECFEKIAYKSRFSAHSNIEDDLKIFKIWKWPQIYFSKSEDYFTSFRMEDDLTFLEFADNFKKIIFQKYADNPKVIFKHIKTTSNQFSKNLKTTSIFVHNFEDNLKLNFSQIWRPTQCIFFTTLKITSNSIFHIFEDNSNFIFHKFKDNFK
jgi:hypothetical protein